MDPHLQTATPTWSRAEGGDGTTGTSHPRMTGRGRWWSLRPAGQGGATPPRVHRRRALCGWRQGSSAAIVGRMIPRADEYDTGEGLGAVKITPAARLQRLPGRQRTGLPAIIRTRKRALNEPCRRSSAASTLRGPQAHRRLVRGDRPAGEVEKTRHKCRTATGTAFIEPY